MAIAVPIADDEVPVFWACGVTPQWVGAAQPRAAVHHPRSGKDVRDRPGRMRLQHARNALQRRLARRAGAGC